MKLSFALAVGVLCAGAMAAIAGRPAIAEDDPRGLLQADGAAFGSGASHVHLNDDLLEANATWTDASGNTRTKSQIIRAIHSGKGLSKDSGGENGGSAAGSETAPIRAHVYGQLGMVQENIGKLYLLRVWVKRPAAWRLLIYQAVSISAPPSAEPGNGGCENPCNTVPFHPRNEDQRDLIHAYQAVETAVTAHDSAAWGSHIAGEFFAVTSNSDRPLDKATRMAGLDKQKEGGIAPFPLVSARMFEFGDAMVMVSRQQPGHGMPLHVTRVWFKRNGVWLEAYSYQTTVQPAASTR